MRSTRIVSSVRGSSYGQPRGEGFFSGPGPARPGTPVAGPVPRALPFQDWTENPFGTPFCTHSGGLIFPLMVSKVGFKVD